MSDGGQPPRTGRPKGHYRTSRVSKFQELAQAGVGANGKLLYFYFALGPFSSFAGIGRVSIDTTASDTGLSRAEIETALAELEKRPTPSRSFILYDRERHIVWVRDYLKEDPARDKDPDILNETHRKGIENTLGDLPRDSPAVRKFRSYYNFHRHTPTRGPAGGMGGGPEVPTTYTEDNKQPPTSDGARARESAPPARLAEGQPPAPSTNSNNGEGKYEPTAAEVDQQRKAVMGALRKTGCSDIAAEMLERMEHPGRIAYYRERGEWPPLPPDRAEVQA
jgi:hypothetical protein